MMKTNNYKNTEKIIKILRNRMKNVENYFNLSFLKDLCPTYLAQRLRKLHWKTRCNR